MYVRSFFLYIGHIQPIEKSADSSVPSLCMLLYSVVRHCAMLKDGLLCFKRCMCCSCRSFQSS